MREMILLLNIVLVNPEIPQNTGNIARTCAATGAMLHLVEPLGFSLSDKYLKRAGLDYWHLMRYRTYPGLEAFLREYPDARMHFATTKAPRDYCAAEYGPDDFLVFGRETAGLPQEIMDRYRDRLIRLPMLPGLRSLNLANTVCATVYEALRQNGFAGML